MPWQWPKSGSASRKAAIDKGRTPSYLSIIPAATRKSAVFVGTSMHNRAADARVRFKKASSLQKGLVPLRSPVAHWHRFSLDRTDWRIDILMMGTRRPGA